MRASLPMYWRAENADAWRRMWADMQAAGRQHGLTLPDLTAPEDIPQPWTAHWLSDDLALSQTCSMPLRTTLRDKVTYVGTFDFGLNGPTGMYHSCFLKTTQHTEPQMLAINGYDSQSGCVAGYEPLQGASMDTAFAKTLSAPLITGSHAGSLKAVAEGKADACYLDAVTYRLCKRYDPWAGDAVLAGETRPTPGLPLITSKGTDPAPLRAILKDVFETASWRGAPELGGLRDFVVLDEATYHALPVPKTADRA